MLLARPAGLYGAWLWFAIVTVFFILLFINSFLANLDVIPRYGVSKNWEPTIVSIIILILVFIIRFGTDLGAYNWSSFLMALPQ